jgi:8-oxo-dGTP pyrophosphatase MutT (NUDIX family)
MKINSCGAVLYTVYSNRVYIILGQEFGDWFPFKGKCDKNETLEEAAIREISEETCMTVNVNKISLDCTFSTARKVYHIGLVFVPYTFIELFYKQRQKMISSKYLEKTNIKMFDIGKIQNYKFHKVTSIPIYYYYPYLSRLQEKINTSVKIRIVECL